MQEEYINDTGTELNNENLLSVNKNVSKLKKPSKNLKLFKGKQKSLTKSNLTEVDANDKAFRQQL